MHSPMTRRQFRLEKQRKTGIHWMAVLITLFTLIIVVTVGWWLRGCFLATPKITERRLVSNTNQTMILDSQNKPVWQSDQQRKLTLKDNQVPKGLKNALTSIEDRSFYHEGGVNYKRTLGAFVVDLVHHNRQQGGSTLTQQLAKDSFFTNSKENKSIKQKVQEIILAERLSYRFSKRRLMTMYVNKVYLGNGVYGMRTAAKYYMHKPVSDLTTSQNALLAGMVQSPSLYNPYAYPKVAKLRRNTVLLTMCENHKISKKSYHILKKRPISNDIIPWKDHAESNKQTTERTLTADPYLENVAKQYGKKRLAADGQSLVIKTPLDMGAQKKLMNIVNSNRVGFPNHKMQTAVTVLNNQTGQVVAQCGGRHQTKIGGLDRATQSVRSTGSTIKPIMDYAPALDNLGWSTSHTVEDTPYDYPGTNSEVRDWDDRHQGAIPLDKALINSRNIPAIRTLVRVGLKRANNVLRLSGLPVQRYYASGIGLPTTTLRLASAYSALANYGVRKKPSYISGVKDNSNHLRKINLPGDRSMSAQTAFMLNKILEQVPQRGEIGSNAYISGLHQAGKTGTTGYSNANAGRSSDAISDAWYAGYTKQYTIVIWTGYDNPKISMNQKQADISENIYRIMMKYMMETNKHANSSDWGMPKLLSHDGHDEYSFTDANKVDSPSK